MTAAPPTATDTARRYWTLTSDPLAFTAGDANLYRYAGNDPVNMIDPDGLAGQKVGDYNVKGKGHHIIPVELWTEFGFAEELYPVLDSEDFLLEAPGHNNLAHGPKTGYTGFLRAELNERLSAYMKRVGSKGKLAVLEQAAFVKEFVEDVREGKVKRQFIVDFNKKVKRGPRQLEKWVSRHRHRYPGYAEEGSAVVIEGIRKIPSSRAARLLSFLGDSSKFLGEKFIPLVGALVTYNAARADGKSPAEAAYLAALEEINPVPIGYEEAQLLADAYDARFQGAKRNNSSRMERIFGAEPNARKLLEAKPSELKKDDDRW